MHLRKSTLFKWITGVLEILLGIPIVGASIILVFHWSPLLIMLCLHIITLVLAKRDQTDLKGSVLGIITSFIAIIPFVGMLMHLLTGIVLLKDAKTLTENDRVVLKREAKFRKIESTYAYNLKPYIMRNYQIAPDTNFLMIFHELMTELHKKTSVQLAINPIVFNELEGLKLSNNRETAKKAQRAFDVLELYQINHRFAWLERANVQKLKNPTNDEKILLSIQQAVTEGQKIIFATHDKGARILARSLKIPVVNPIKQAIKDPLKRESNKQTHLP